MIHSSRPTFPAIAIAVFTCNLFCFARFWKVRSAEWINSYSLSSNRVYEWIRLALKPSARLKINRFSLLYYTCLFKNPSNNFKSSWQKEEERLSSDEGSRKSGFSHWVGTGTFSDKFMSHIINCIFLSTSSSTSLLGQYTYYLSLN